MSAQDPQATVGRTPAAEIGPPCHCGHLSSVHQPTGRTAKYLGACSAADPRPCRCRLYEPQREAS